MQEALKRVFLLFFTTSLIYPLRAQESLDSTINFVWRSVLEQRGNLFLDTVYGRMDTSKLKARFPEELNREIDFIRAYNLKLTEWKPRVSGSSVSRIRTIKEFYEERKKPVYIPTWEDSVMNFRMEEWMNRLNRFSSDPDSLDKLNKITDLVYGSSWKERIDESYALAQAKLMKILGIYQSDKWILVIYELMYLFGYPHYYPRSELIFK